MVAALSRSKLTLTKFNHMIRLIIDAIVLSLMVRAGMCLNSKHGKIFSQKVMISLKREMIIMRQIKLLFKQCLYRIKWLKKSLRNCYPHRNLMEIQCKSKQKVNSFQYAVNVTRIKYILLPVSRGSCGLQQTSYCQKLRDNRGLMTKSMSLRLYLLSTINVKNNSKA